MNAACLLPELAAQSGFHRIRQTLESHFRGKSTLFAGPAQGAQGRTGGFFIIMAAAATTIVAMLPLFAMGFGAFKSFALITIAGVLIGVFIARPAYGRIVGLIMQGGE